MPLDEIENFNSVEGITQVLRSIFYYDGLQTWKSWQMESNRIQRENREAASTHSGPISQLQSRYIRCHSFQVPYSHGQYQQIQTQEERKAIETNLRKLDLALEWFRSLKVELDPSDPDQL